MHNDEIEIESARDYIISELTKTYRFDGVMDVN